MSKEICCPKCQSENVRSIDNQPLYHASKGEVEVAPTMKLDTEIYIAFICDDCQPTGGRAFTKVFNLVPKE